MRLDSTNFFNQYMFQPLSNDLDYFDKVANLFLSAVLFCTTLASVHIYYYFTAKPLDNEERVSDVAQNYFYDQNEMDYNAVKEEPLYDQNELYNNDVEEELLYDQDELYINDVKEKPLLVQQNQEINQIFPKVDVLGDLLKFEQVEGQKNEIEPDIQPEGQNPAGAHFKVRVDDEFVEVPIEYIDNFENGKDEIILVED